MLDSEKALENEKPYPNPTPTTSEETKGENKETEPLASSGKTSQNREFKLVASRNIHRSSVLPPRGHNQELSKSVKLSGIQTPIIVRPIAEKPGEYELIDGLGRLESLEGDEQVLVDIRRDTTDPGAFEISNATFQRKDRTAHEAALFYAAWLKALEKHHGQIEGLQQKLASLAGFHESSLSQYLAIARMFEKLQQLSPNEQFGNLKSWSVNKLYKLSELSDDPRLAEVATLFEKKIESSLEEVDKLVNPCLAKDKAQEQILGEPSVPFKSEEPQPEPSQPPAFPDSENRKISLKQARRMGRLAVETLNTLKGLGQTLDKDTNQSYPTDVLQTLTKVFHALRKLKRTLDDLQQKISAYTRASKK